MKDVLPKPSKQEILYQDEKLYACLARYPLVKGHVIIAWKRKVKDLHLLSRKEYEHLMDCVDEIRTAMMKALRVRKVYLFYMDEMNQVHWHLIPRYNEKGFTMLRHTPGKIADFSAGKKISVELSGKKGTGFHLKNF